MSKLAVLLLLAGFTSASFAATRVTVAEAEEILRAAQAMPDVKAAERLAGLEMVERVSSRHLAQWQAQFPGEHSRAALLALADASAFLDLPTAEIPALVKPDPPARREILLRTVEYVNTTIHKLPNFSARRTTTHFDNVSPSQRLFNEYLKERERNLNYDISPPRIPNTILAGPLRMGDTSSALVTYRNGLEVKDSESGDHAEKQSADMGFTTSGEFGPILSVVLRDAISGEMFWDHWEQGKDEPLAVFRYAVPQQKSHYTLIGLDGKAHLPAYHGQIAVNPKDGTILRVTLVSEQDSAARFESAILVEYAPVAIGNESYVCPVRGVAISRFPEFTPLTPTHDLGWGRPLDIKMPAQTFVNDVSFTDYHVFRADMRILP